MSMVPGLLLGAYTGFGRVHNHRLIERASAVEPGAGIAFELNSKRGAALVTKHYTYREDIEREVPFEDYIKKHYQSWVDFSLEQGHGRNIKPILVTGVDLTRDFATVAYSDNQTRLRCEFSVAVPAVASASASLWGSWDTGGLVHTNCGPHLVATRGDRGSSESSALQAETTDEYDQCVFIRYYTIRTRFFIPTVIKAGAGQHQLPKSDRTGDNAGEDPIEVDYLETGLRTNADEEGPHPSPGDDSMELDCSETGPGATAFDEVIHNVPPVCPERYPHLPPLTNWTKDDRDGFDILAEFIFQVSNPFLWASDAGGQIHLTEIRGGISIIASPRRSKPSPGMPAHSLQFFA